MKYYLKKGADKKQPYSIEELIKIREDITTQVISFYSRLPQVNSILLVGSRNGKPQDHYSDLDFFIFYDGIPPSTDARKNLISSLQFENEHIFVFDDHSYEYGISDDFEVNSVEVCQTFYCVDNVKKQVNSVYHGFYRKIGFYYPMAIVAAIAESEIIYAKDLFINTLKVKCASYPPFLKTVVIQEELPMINYYMSRICLAIFRNDKFYFDDLVYQAIDSILQVIFALNSTYLYSRKDLKNKINKLKCKPEKFFENLLFLIDKIGESESMKKKQTILALLTQQLNSLSNLDEHILSNQCEMLKVDVNPYAEHFLNTENHFATNI